jgi:hypothetical protein
MLLQRISRTAPEKVFAICRNSEASAEMFDGEVVTWSVAVGANHGSDVLKSAGAAPLTIAGVVSSKAISGAGNGIAAGEYGPIQIFGYHSAVKTTAAALAAGLTVNGDSAAAAVAGAAGDDPSARLGVSLKLGATNRAGIFIKCLG